MLDANQIAVYPLPILAFILTSTLISVLENVGIISQGQFLQSAQRMADVFDADDIRAVITCKILNLIF